LLVKIGQGKKWPRRGKGGVKNPGADVFQPQSYAIDPSDRLAKALWGKENGKRMAILSPTHLEGRGKKEHDLIEKKTQKRTGEVCKRARCVETRTQRVWKNREGVRGHHFFQKTFGKGSGINGEGNGTSEQSLPQIKKTQRRRGGPFFLHPHGSCVGMRPLAGGSNT